MNSGVPFSPHLDLRAKRGVAWDSACMAWHVVGKTAWRVVLVVVCSLGKSVMWRVAVAQACFLVS